MKKVERDLKKKDKNIKIEKWKPAKNQKKESKKNKKSGSEESDDAQEEVKKDSLLLNVSFFEQEIKEKDFKKKFFDQIAFDLGKDGGINCLEQKDEKFDLKEVEDAIKNFKLD